MLCTFSELKRLSNECQYEDFALGKKGQAIALGAAMLASGLGAGKAHATGFNPIQSAKSRAAIVRNYVAEKAQAHKDGVTNADLQQAQDNINTLQANNQQYIGAMTNLQQEMSKNPIEQVKEKGLVEGIKATANNIKNKKVNEERMKAYQNRVNNNNKQKIELEKFVDTYDGK